VETSRPADGTDAAIIADARKLLADDQPEQAKKLLDSFIERAEDTNNPLLPQAYLLRGDAITASGDEYKALYDYETVIKSYAASPPRKRWRAWAARSPNTPTKRSPPPPRRMCWAGASVGRPWHCVTTACRAWPR
jgi:hypothetical protein